MTKKLWIPQYEINRRLEQNDEDGDRKDEDLHRSAHRVEKMLQAQKKASGPLRKARNQSVEYPKQRRTEQDQDDQCE